MGIYDPAFERKPFSIKHRDGEVPGSVVLGTNTSSKGCVWPGTDGRWYAAKPDAPKDKPYPNFETKQEALAWIVDPLRIAHEAKEDARQKVWADGEPKRAERAEKQKGREEKRRPKKGDKVFVVTDAQGLEIGRVIRPTYSEAYSAAASLLGFRKLPEGYVVKEYATPSV